MNLTQKISNIINIVDEIEKLNKQKTELNGKLLSTAYALINLSDENKKDELNKRYRDYSAKEVSIAHSLQDKKKILNSIFNEEINIPVQRIVKYVASNWGVDTEKVKLEISFPGIFFDEAIDKYDICKFIGRLKQPSKINISLSSNSNVINFDCPFKPTSKQLNGETLLQCVDSTYSEIPGLLSNPNYAKHINPNCSLIMRDPNNLILPYTIADFFDNNDKYKLNKLSNFILEVMGIKINTNRSNTVNGETSEKTL